MSLFDPLKNKAAFLHQDALLRTSNYTLFLQLCPLLSTIGLILDPFWQCNEVHPVCGGCQRHKVPCVYPRARQNRHQTPTTDREATAPDSRASEEQPGQVAARGEVHNESPWNDVTWSHTLAGEPILPESKERRLLEMRLLHHWMVSTSLTILSPGEPERRNLWILDVPRSVYYFPTEMGISS